VSNTIGPPPTGIGWDEDYPDVDLSKIGNSVYEIRDLRKGMRIRVEKEHVTPAASSAGGEHKQGSAVSWCQASQPTTRPDGSTDLDSDDLGRTWYDTTNSVLKILTAVGTPDTFTVCYDIIDEDDMATDSATRPPSQQSVKAHVATGTVTMTNKTLTSPVLNTGLSGTAFLDEDNMASNSATKVASQQSIKAYVDTVDAANSVTDQAYADSVGAAITSWPGFGERTSTDTDSNALAKTNVYLAEVDGFLTVISENISSVTIGSDAVDASTTIGTMRSCNPSSGSDPILTSTFPIKEDDYVKVTGTVTTIAWTPIGTGGLVKQ